MLFLSTCHKLAEPMMYEQRKTARIEVSQKHRQSLCGMSECASSSFLRVGEDVGEMKHPLRVIP